jgi:hypothetical protein
LSHGFLHAAIDESVHEMMHHTRVDGRTRREIEEGFLLLELTRQRAEDIVRDRGWSESDEDFALQIEEEMKRQWEEEYVRRYPVDIPIDGE